MISLETYKTIKLTNRHDLLKKFDTFADQFKKRLKIDFNYKIILGSRIHGECHSVLNDDGSETSNFLIRLTNKIDSFADTYVDYLMYHELAHIPQFINYGTMFKHDVGFYDGFVKVVPHRLWEYEVQYIPSSKRFFNQVCTKS